MLGSEVAGEYTWIIRSLIRLGKSKSAAMYLPFDDVIFWTCFVRKGESIKPTPALFGWSGSQSHHP